MKKEKLLLIIMVIAVIFIFLVLGFYFSKFHYGLSNDQTIWGTFGDYIGGILNPIFAFLGLLAILLTIVLQRKELEFSREELQLSREELSKSADALQKQNITIQLQRFENSFFQLLQFQNQIIDGIVMHWAVINGQQNIFFKGRSSFNKLYSYFKRNYYNDLKRQSLIYRISEKFLNEFQQDLIDNDVFDILIKEKECVYSQKSLKHILFHKLKHKTPFIENIILENTKENNKLTEREIAKYSYEYFMFDKEENIGHYFRHLYHIINFIDKRKPLSLEDEDLRLYSRLVRAQLSKYEIGLLFYNGLSDYGEKFKPLIEKYSLLKGLDEDILIEQSHKEYYQPIAFGE